MKFLARRFRQSPAVGVAVVAAVAATGGMAVASIHESNPSIHACAAKRGGALRLLTSGHCRRDERAVSWNERGVQGHAGAPGQAGPSQVYTKNVGSIDPLGTDPFAVVGSINVPAGSYIVIGRADFYNSGGNAGDRPGCTITTGPDMFHGTYLDGATDELGANSVGSWHIFGGVTLVGTVTLSKAGTLLLNCSQVGSDPNVSASGVKLTATRVGSLTVAP